MYKSYFNISEDHPGVRAMHSIHPETGDQIDAIIDAHDSEKILQGYLSAADIIVKSLRARNKFINLDNILFPLLFLYVSLLEFCIKIILNKLIDHQKEGCLYLQQVPSSIQDSHGLKV